MDGQDFTTGLLLRCIILTNLMGSLGSKMSEGLGGRLAGIYGLTRYAHAKGPVRILGEFYLKA